MTDLAAIRTTTARNYDIGRDLLEQSAETPKQKCHRRLSRQQGAALDILGHAIEYLEDTNFYAARSHHPAVVEALGHLKQASRAVFQVAPDEIRARERAACWLLAYFGGGKELAETPRAAKLVLVKR